MYSYLKKQLVTYLERKMGNFYFKQEGYCPCCEEEVVFMARDPWLRDYFRCSNCRSIPRERALMHVIKTTYPDWERLAIHESSPGGRGHSVLLKQKVKAYTETQYFVDAALGVEVKGFRNENLECQTFDDAVFDLVVTSDVMEHIYEPDKAFKEIHRTLKPGGAHIFSVPLINKHQPTQRWANKGTDGEPEFLFTPEWHGNPIDKKGSPVTYHWGYDITDYITKHTGAVCEIVYIDDLSQGIRAEYIDIIVAKKPLDD